MHRHAGLGSDGPGAGPGTLLQSHLLSRSWILASRPGRGLQRVKSTCHSAAGNAVHTPLESMSSLISVVHTYTHTHGSPAGGVNRGRQAQRPQRTGCDGGIDGALGARGPALLWGWRGAPGPWAAASAVSGGF